MNLIKLGTDCNVAFSTVETALRHMFGKMAGTTPYAYEFAVQPYREKNPALSVLNRQDVMGNGDKISFVFGIGLEKV